MDYITEDKVKEIAAKICHEKTKGLFEKIDKRLDSLECKIKWEIWSAIQRGDLKLERYFDDESWEVFQKKLHHLCRQHVEKCIQFSYEKFKDPFNIHSYE